MVSCGVLMKTITVRGIDDELDAAIREISKQEQESMNRTIVRLLKQAAGLDESMPFPVHHDLDSLAGTWSKGSEDAFRRNTEQFRRIDKELWNAEHTD